MMKGKLFFKTILFMCLSYTINLNAQTCDCTEYLYMNETTNGGAIHKYSLNDGFNPATDDASQAIGAEIGSPWFDNLAAGEDVTNPHGLGADLNGYLYIGEGSRANNGHSIRRFTCDGDIIPSATFEIPEEGGYNFSSENNILYVGTQDFDSATPNYINAYDLCTGDLIGFYCMNNISEVGDWGLFLADNGDMYLTSDFRNPTQSNDVPNNLYKFNINSTPLNAVGEANPTCVDPFITEGTNPPTVGTNDFARDGIFGVTVDNDGNIYIVERTGANYNDFPGGVTDGAARILKYDSSGTLVSISPYDGVEGDNGYFKAIGIYYSETLDALFVSTASPDLNEDCVSLFDTDLNYLGTAVANPGGDTQAKGINIQSECCPNPSTIVIDTILCNLTYPVDIFLQDFLNCDGVVCEGAWTEDVANTGISFNGCDNSITISGDQACGTFDLFSDGSNALSQCGQFSITVNIETETITVPTITADQTLCPTDTPADLVATSTTPDVTYQWQMSTTSCTEGFTDIAGATTDTYTPASITQTTYYRVMSSVAGNCASGNCSEPSDCVTLTLDTNCETFDLRLGKVVDVMTTTIGAPVTFTLTVNNEGTGDVTGVEVTDVLPAGLTYSSDDGGGNYDNGTGVWMIGSIVAGDSAVINITATVDIDGVIINEAEITAMDQIDIDSTPDNDDPNEDDIDSSCISIPVECCDNEAINVDLTAPTGYTNYQWYLDGVLIAGETSEMYTATAIGSYIYTVDGVGPTGDCMGELCCPVIIEQVSCCPPIQCIQIGVTKLEE